MRTHRIAQQTPLNAVVTCVVQSLNCVQLSENPWIGVIRSPVTETGRKMFPSESRKEDNSRFRVWFPRCLARAAVTNNHKFGGLKQ